MQNDETASVATGDEASEIIGLVSPRGASASTSYNSPTWSLVCRVQPWRVVGQPTQETPITLVLLGSEAETKELMHVLHPYTIIRARIRIRPDQPTHADVVELIDTAITDADLEARAVALQTPVTRDDAVFGTLTYDRSLDWWRVGVTWNGAATHLSISADDDELDAALEVAYQLWNEQAEWDTRLRAYAAQELLDLKNDGWLDDEQQPITAQQFMDALTIESLSIEDDGGFTVYYDDGDLFFGHVVIVGGTLKDGPNHAEMAG